MEAEDDDDEEEGGNNHIKKHIISSSQPLKNVSKRPTPVYKQNSATAASVIIITIPVSSFLALRKAITSMKDVGSFITLRTTGFKTLQISVIDHFGSSVLYVPLPVLEYQGNAWVHIACEELNKLVSLLKAYPHAIHLTITSCQHAVFANATTKEPLLQQSYICPDILHPRTFVPILDNDYYWVTFVSVDLLAILVDLCIGSPVMKLTLLANGELVFGNKYEMGETIIKKQLSYFGKKQQKRGGSVVTVPVKSFSLKTTASSSPTSTATATIRCVVKFIKQIVNPLVNCSKKTSLLGIPKNGMTNPLVIQFLLSRGIYGYFLMMPFHIPLQHVWRENSYQNPVQLQQRKTTKNPRKEEEHFIKGFQQEILVN